MIGISVNIAGGATIPEPIRHPVNAANVKIVMNVGKTSFESCDQYLKGKASLMSNVAINVSSDILRKIIEEQPEISLKLATMAHEKIAEEIIRKVKNTSLDEIEDRVNSNVSRAIAAATDI